MRKGSVASGLQKRACPYHITKTRHENTRKTDVLHLYFLLRMMGAAARRTTSWEYVATLVGGRAAAAFLFGWHGVFCWLVGLRKKYTLNVWHAPRPRFYIYPLCALFVSLSPFFCLVFSILFFALCVSICFCFCFCFCLFPLSSFSFLVRCVSLSCLLLIVSYFLIYI